ncbi:ring-H2 finger ATL65-like protein, putative [Medicago truncatula]|uniref:Ring-H2 finger ATL65-like protein, putative n=1 Tax=Medicago truncatula TaxID=3880 RepID=G7LE59_MEDTR|nr:ring-H2 finger ATL65-like protein, putative [Medicago truncatula]
MKSPFFQQRGFFPLSELSVRYADDGGSSWRSSTSIVSPMFSRSSTAVFSSSRLRCGNPVALLSPERFNRQQ